MAVSTSYTVHLIDALPYVFRAYFSLPSSIVDPRGAPVNAVRGWTSFLLRYLDEERPTHVVAAFDESLTTSFRNEFYPAYKSSRELPPPELEAQLEACRDVAEALGLPTLASERYEADDLIGALVKRLVARGHTCVVVTSDKDLGQLVGPQVTLYDFAKALRYTPDGILAKFGVRPEQIPDYLGLAGDAVDDIPGVAGVGAKTAAALLVAYADLDALYADLEGVAALPIRGARTLGAKLEAGRESAFQSRRLATLAYEAPVRASLRGLARRKPEDKRLTELFERLGFEGLLERARRSASGAG